MNSRTIHRKAALEQAVMRDELAQEVGHCRTRPGHPAVADGEHVIGQRALQSPRLPLRCPEVDHPGSTPCSGRIETALAAGETS